MAFPTGWAYRIPITIDHTLVDSDLTDFTFLLDKSFDAVLTQDNGPLDLDGTRSSLSGGGDLRFSSDEAGNNQLAIDVRQWEPANDPTSSTCGCDVAVKIPTVSSTADTTIYLWWGKSGETQPAVTDTYGQYNAYASHVSGWWSMEDGVTPDDHTSNQNHGINASGGVDADGKVGIGRSYDGNGIVDLTTHITNDAPFSLFFAYYKRSQGGGDYGSIFGSDGYTNGFRHLSTDELNVRVGGDVKSSTPALSNNTWHFVTFQNDGTGWTSSANLITGSGGGTGSFSIEHLIGIANASDRAFDGIVDEIHFHTIAVGADWEKAQYYNMMEPGVILTFGSITDISSGDDLTASDITSVTNAETGTLGQLHKLTGTEIDSTSSVETSDISQVHSLTGTEIASDSSVDNSTIGQEHSLSANEIYTISNVDIPVLEQEHNLSTNEISSTSSVDNSQLEEIYNLTPVDIFSNTELDSPALSVEGEDNLSVEDISSNVDYDTPTIQQEHSLNSEGIDSAVNLETPDLVAYAVLGSESIELTTSIETPTVGQLHNLESETIESNSNVEIADFSQVHILDSKNIESTTSVGKSSTTVISNLFPVSIESQSTTTTPTISQVHNISSNSISFIVELQNPDFILGNNVLVQPDIMNLTINAIPAVSGQRMFVIRNLSSTITDTLTFTSNITGKFLLETVI